MIGWSLTGISFPVECVYTQTLGVYPDVAMLRCNPQVGAFPTVGDLTLTWGADTVTLPDCQLDLARITYAQQGFYVQIPCLDRRWLWEYAAPISGNYNIWRSGTYITAFKQNIRQLVTILLTALGEASIDVSALPTNIYPEVSWDCEEPRIALQELLEAYGYSVALNYGTEDVVVVQLGTGAALPSTNVAVPSFTFDPKIRPRWVRVCFGPSKVQARFLAKPVVRESDGTWVTPASASYAPAGGWASEDPEILPYVATSSSTEDYNNAVATAFRAYHIEKFSQDNLTIPISGAGALTDIQQVLPLENRLISSETIRPDGSGSPLRVWAKHDRKVREKGQPEEAREAVGIDFEITRYQYFFDGETGIIIFPEPLYYTDAGGNQFAEVYIETTFSVWSPTTNAAVSYYYDVSFDTAGVGYKAHRVPEKSATSVVLYDDATHIPTGTVVTNATALNTEATDIAASLVASMTDQAAVDIIYSIPKLAIRCDGAIRQVQHIMTEGERQHAVNRTRASRHTEFDRAIPTRRQRVAHGKAVDAAIIDRWIRAKQKQRDRTND